MPGRLQDLAPPLPPGGEPVPQRGLQSLANPMIPEYIGSSWGQFPEAKKDKTAVYLPFGMGMPFNALDSGFPMDDVQVKPVDYNLDYDEEVDDLFLEMEQDHAMKKAFYSRMEQIRKAAEAGNIKAINTYEAMRDALNKKDPMGFRAGGRYNPLPEPNSSVEPDFNWKAVEGKDDDEKKENFNTVRNRYKRWHLD